MTCWTAGGRGARRVGGVFDGFTLERVDVGEAVLRVRHGGSGPPVLLLHGHPRTHATWHRVAPLLARDFTVVCPDLRGYGRSVGPPADADHTAYSKRAMARDFVALMRSLGHERFAVVWPARTPGSRRPGGTGSSSARRRSPRSG